MKKTAFLLPLLLLAVNAFAQFKPEIPKVEFVDYQSENRVWFARCMQFQTSIAYGILEDSGLPYIKDEAAYFEKVLSCLDIAKENNVNILIFPEVSFCFSEKYRKRMLRIMQEYAAANDAIILAGTYYNKDRECKSVTVLPTGVFESSKIRPSVFEASTQYGKGMVGSDTCLVFRTKYGNFLPMVCVDLISDDVNYLALSLSNRGLIDAVFNIEYNPKSQEFMRVASYMCLRHPLFVSLTNVCLHQKGGTYDGDEYGNTSLFGSTFKEMVGDQILSALPDFYKTEDRKDLQPAYSTMLGIIPPEIEGALMYDLNLRVVRAPLENNAPDQGYPTVRNLQVISLEQQ